MSLNPTVSVRFFVTSLGNEFMLDIAHLYAEAVSRAGAGAEVIVDGLPDSDSVNSRAAVNVIVAPHEYFPLFVAPQTISRSQKRLLERAVPLNVEQPKTQWFRLATKSARQAPCVLDLSPSTAPAWRRRGVRAIPAPLGYVPSMEVTSPAKERDIEIVFLGYLSPRREKFIAEHATWFAEHRCHLGFIRGDKPATARTPGYLATAERIAILSRAKIVLNVHARDTDYFEVHRLLPAMANRCLVVSEASRFMNPFVAAKHLIVGELERLPELCEHYLSDEAAREKLTSAAYQFVTEERRGEDLAKEWLKQL